MSEPVKPSRSRKMVIFSLLILIALLSVALVYKKTTLDNFVNNQLQQALSKTLPNFAQLKKLSLRWNFKEILSLNPILLELEVVLFERFQLQLKGTLSLRKQNSEQTGVLSIEYRPQVTFTDLNQQFGSEDLTIQSFEGSTLVSLKIDTAKKSLSELSFIWTLDSATERSHLKPQLTFLNGEISSQFEYAPDGSVSHITFRLKDLDSVVSHYLVGPVALKLNAKDTQIEGSFRPADCSLMAQIQSKVIGRSIDSNLKINLNYQSKSFQANLCNELQITGDHKVTDFIFEQVEPRRMVGIGALRAHVDFTNTVKAHLKMNDLEILNGENYFAPQLNHLSFDLSLNQSATGLKTYSALIQSAKNSLLDASYLSTNHFDFKLNVPSEEVRKILPDWFTNLEVFNGKISTHLKGQLSGPLPLLDFGSYFTFRIDELLYPAKKLALKGLQVRLKRQSGPLQQQRTELLVQLNRGQQHNLRFLLQPSRFQFALMQNDLVIEPSKIFFAIDEMGLLPIAFEGRIAIDDPFLNHSLKTQLLTKTVPLRRIAQKLCLLPDSFPAGDVRIRFAEINLDDGELTTRGAARIYIFDGSVVINQLQAQNIGTGITPSAKFNILFQNLDLNQLGEFSQFGGMQGLLVGHLKDISFNGMLLNDYNFRAKLEPLPGSQKIYFSQRATKNLIQVLAKGQGVANGSAGLLIDLASQILGDYGIDYAGLQAKTQNSFVVLTTFDPPQTVKDGSIHYLLNGPRIKMPVSSRTYPIVLSRSGWAGFVSYFIEQLQSIMADDSSSEEPPQKAEPCFIEPLGE